MIDDKGQEYDVEPSKYEDARNQGLTTVLSFTDAQGQEVAVPEDKLDDAFKSGLKPKDHKEIPFWQSISRGFKEGFRTMPGFGEAFGNVETPETKLEASQAWSEDPVSYATGKAVGALAGPAITALGGYAGMKAGGKIIPQGVKTRASAAKIATQEAVKGGLEASKKTELGLGADIVAKPVAALVGAGKTALDVYPHAVAEGKRLEALKAQMANTDEGGFFSSKEKPSFPMTDVLVKPGQSDIKSQLAERAATIAPQNLSKEMLDQILQMGTQRRQTARGFMPQKASEEITPELKNMLSQLESKKSGAFSKLHSEARGQYTPEMGDFIPSQIESQQSKIKDVQGLSSTVIGTVAQVNQILNEGPEVFKLKPGPFNQVTPQDQFDRLQAAREVLDGRLRVMARSNDPAINDRTSMRILQESRDKIDEVLKTLPAKQKADQLYAAGTKARKEFFDKMEFGKGKARDIDAATVERLFGNNATAKRQKEGIEYMKTFLELHGDDILPAEKARMQKTVQRFEELRSIAEDKRLIEAVRQQPGPTSPAYQATEAMRVKTGLPGKFDVAPSGEVRTLDEFFTSRAKSEFGKNVNDLSQKEFNILSKMFNWRQSNPNAMIDRENQVFKQFRKGK
jgi:hypothetical protein